MRVDCAMLCMLVLYAIYCSPISVVVIFFPVLVVCTRLLEFYVLCVCVSCIGLRID